MKRVVIVEVIFITMLALAVPLVMADQVEPPPTNPDGSCSGPGCK